MASLYSALVGIELYRTLKKGRRINAKKYARF
jgi:hypothetical protein